MLQTLSLSVLDEELKLVKRRFKGDDSIKKIPMQKTMADLCEYVSKTYFKPPLGKMHPHEYKTKRGVGKPVPLDGATLLTDIKLAQKDKHVPWPRLSLYAKADLCEFPTSIHFVLVCPEFL